MRLWSYVLQQLMNNDLEPIKQSFLHGLMSSILSNGAGPHVVLKKI